MVGEGNRCYAVLRCQGRAQYRLGVLGVNECLAMKIGSGTSSREGDDDGGCVECEGR